MLNRLQQEVDAEYEAVMERSGSLVASEVTAELYSTLVRYHELSAMRQE